MWYKKAVCWQENIWPFQMKRSVSMKEKLKIIACSMAGIAVCGVLGVGIFFNTGKNNAEQLMEKDITSDSIKSELVQQLQDEVKMEELNTEVEAVVEEKVPILGETLTVDGEEIDIQGKDVWFNGTEIIVDGNTFDIVEKEVLVDGEEISGNLQEDIAHAEDAVINTENDIVNTEDAANTEKDEVNSEQNTENAQEDKINSEQNTGNAEKNEINTEENTEDIIVYKGKKYRYKDNLFNVVCLGIDKYEEMGDRHPDTNSLGQSDVMLMTSLDLDTNKISIIAIPRDTMVMIELYSAKGKYFGQKKGQITLQYAYGDGKELSAVLASQQVSKVLNDVPVNAYAAINLNSLQVIGDSIGGVDVTMDKDYTYIDPAFQKGKTVHLEGEMLEKFVRYRDVTVFASAESRIERQKVLLKAFVSQGKDAVVKNPSLFVSLMHTLGEHLETNVTVDTASYLATEVAKCSFSSGDLYVLPGKVVKGEKYEEYYLDEDAVMDIIIKVFYEPVQ